MLSAPVSKRVFLSAAARIIADTIAAAAVFQRAIVDGYRNQLPYSKVKPLIHLFLTCENGWIEP